MRIRKPSRRSLITWLAIAAVWAVVITLGVLVWVIPAVNHFMYTELWPMGLLTGYLFGTRRRRKAEVRSQQGSGTDA